jgi:hypothetical protein
MPSSNLSPQKSPRKSPSKPGTGGLKMTPKPVKPVASDMAKMVKELSEAFDIDEVG